MDDQTEHQRHDEDKLAQDKLAQDKLEWDKFFKELLEHERNRYALYPRPTEPLSRAEQFDADVDGYVARRVRSARLEDRLSQAQLGDAVAISQARLSRIERGYSAIRVNELVKIAIQLRRPIPWFVEPPEEDRGDIVSTGWEPVVRTPMTAEPLDAFLGSDA